MQVLYEDRGPVQPTDVEAPYVADEFEGRSMAVDVGRWQFSEYTQLQLDYFQFNHSGYLNRLVTFDRYNYAPGSSLRVRNHLLGVGLAQTV